MMFRRLIFFILTPVALWMLTACQSADDEPKASSHEVVFTPEIASRATPITNNTITDSPFTVFGDMIRIDSPADNHPIKIYNATEVRYEGGQWTYDTPAYWIPDYQHSFVALYPASASCLSDFDYSDSQLSFTYTYPLGNYKNANDVLTATHRRNYFNGEAEAVRFNFGHILSNINVKVTYTDPTVPANLNITGITFMNIPAKATYALKPSSLSGGGQSTYDTDVVGETGGWTIKERGNLEIKFTGDDVKIIPNDRNAETPLFSNSDALLLLPNQALPNQESPVTTQIALSYTTYEKPEGIKRNVTAIIPNGWSPGRNFVLLLTITKGYVQFSVTVKEWKDGESKDTTVPRK